jgi:hypothetical protein
MLLPTTAVSMLILLAITSLDHLDATANMLVRASQP